MSNVQITKCCKNATTDKSESPAHPRRSSPDFQMAQSRPLTPFPRRLRAIWKSGYEEVKASVHSAPRETWADEYEVLSPLSPDYVIDFVGGTVVYDGYCCISFSVLSSDVMHQAVQNGFQPLLGQCSLVNNHQPPPPLPSLFLCQSVFLPFPLCLFLWVSVCVSVCLSVCLVRMGGWFVQAVVLDFVWQTLVG